MAYYKSLCSVWRRHVSAKTTSSDCRTAGSQPPQCSPLYDDLWWALMDAPLGAAVSIAEATLSPEMVRHPVFAETVREFRESETRDILAEELRKGHAERGKRTAVAMVRRFLLTGEIPKMKIYDRGRNVIENKGQNLKYPNEFMETQEVSCY